MTITESRLKSGTLTIGDDSDAETFACQATNVRVSPSYDDDGDAVETLCGDSIPAGKKESWVLAGTSIQDFDDPEGFLAYCYANAMTTVPFTWTPNPSAPTFSGRCVVVALEEGGDVNTRLTTDWEFACAGRVIRTAAGALTIASVEPGEDEGTALLTGANLTDDAAPMAADVTDTVVPDGPASTPPIQPSTPGTEGVTP